MCVTTTTATWSQTALPAVGWDFCRFVWDQCSSGCAAGRVGGGGGVESCTIIHLWLLRASCAPRLCAPSRRQFSAQQEVATISGGGECRKRAPAHVSCVFRTQQHAAGGGDETHQWWRRMQEARGCCVRGTAYLICGGRATGPVSLISRLRRVPPSPRSVSFRVPIGHTSSAFRKRILTAAHSGARSRER